MRADQFSTQTAGSTPTESGVWQALRSRAAVRGAIVALVAIASLSVWSAPASATIQYDSQFSGTLLGGTLFVLPSRVAVDASGNDFVTDTGNTRIQEYDSAGSAVRKWGTVGTGNLQFLAGGPIGVATDSGGNVYAVDTGNNRVQKFSPTGTYIAQWGGTGTGNGQFTAPQGIAIDSGHVYVADTGNNRIQEFDTSGAFVRAWGSVGVSDGQFTLPTAVGVDSDGNVYVADTGNSRVEKFDSTGNFIRKWGSVGTGDGQFGAAVTPSLDLAVDSSDNVIVVDPTNNRVEKFRPVGTFITKWGTLGTGNGQFATPAGVAISSSDSIHVVDRGLVNGRVEVFHETDTTDPDTSLDSGPLGVSNGDVSFTFSSAEPQLLTPGFECRLDTTEWEACGSPKAYTNLSEGSHTFRVRAVDAAGNPDPTPSIRTWTVDRTPAETTLDSGPSGPTNDPSPSFGFSSEAGASFQCRIDSSQPSDWQSCSSPKAYAALADGSHTFEVRASDPVGNTDPSPASRSFTVDTLAPQTSIDSGPSGPTNDPTPSLSFSSSELGSNFQCRIDSSQPTDWQSCTSPKSYGSLADGSHTVQVRAIDAAGNVDLSLASRTFTVDTVAPQTLIDSGPSGPTNDPSPSFSFSSSELGSTFQCRIDSSQASDWQSCGSPQVYANLSDGSHTVQMRAIDPAGNIDLSLASRTFTIDTAAPQTTIDSGPSGPTNDPSPSFSFSSSEPGSTFQCRIDSTQPSDWQSCSSPQAYPNLPDGSHAVQVRATDAVGNIDLSAASDDFRVDTQAPASPQLTATVPGSPSNQNVPKVKGTAESGSKARLFKTAGCTGTPAVVGSAAKLASPGLTGSVPNNSVTSFRATAQDAAGNVSACSAPISYTEDSKRPAVPQITATNPGSPANQNVPKVKGTAEAGSRVRLYKTSDCTGTPLNQGSAAKFASPGLAASVPDNSTTSFRATARDAAGNTSPCSAARTYVEDSRAPGAPAIKVVSPASPANNNQPKVKGFAAAPSVVNIYKTADCTGSPLASGTASQFQSGGLVVSVPDDTTTSFRAAATDPAGNRSQCSASFNYVEDSTAPKTSITFGPPSTTTNRRPTFRFQSNEPGTTFRCRFDAKPFGRCSGPGASHRPYVALSLGVHSFEVVAMDKAGNTDPTPSRRTFTIVP